MDEADIQRIAKQVAYKNVNEEMEKAFIERQGKYEQMVHDILCQHQSRKEFLASAMKPKDYIKMPQELAREYTRRVNNAHFLTTCVENAMEGIESAELRQVIDLTYFQHETITQIMDRLFCSNNTVLRWKQKALHEIAVRMFGVDALGLEEL